MAYPGGGGAQGHGSSTPLRLRGMQLINTNMPKFITKARVYNKGREYRTCYMVRVICVRKVTRQEFKH